MTISLPYSCFHFFPVNTNIKLGVELGELPLTFVLGSAQREAGTGSFAQSLPRALTAANCYCPVRPQRWGIIIQGWLARQEGRYRTWL